MVWVPAGAAFGGGGKSSGKGGKAQNPFKKAPVEKKVWLSGLPQGIAKGAELDKMNKKLQKHLSQDGIKCKSAEIWKNGNGQALFGTKEDVEKAMESLNGAEFEDNAISIDSWEKKEKD